MTLSLADTAGSFAVTCLPAPDPAALVLFAVGGGGDPARHGPLLDHLSRRGLTVVAPHFERLAALRATSDEVLLRARRLSLALAAAERPDLPVTGIGHSIGASTLLGLAGGRLWLDAGGPLPIERELRLTRLALLAPATVCFRAPGALGEIDVPVLAIGASEDDVTPPAQTEFLHNELAGQVPVETRVIQGAGHFSFMNQPPPHVNDPLPDRDAFLELLADDLAGFALQ